MHPNKALKNKPLGVLSILKLLLSEVFHLYRIHHRASRYRLFQGLCQLGLSMPFNPRKAAGALL